MKEKHMIENEIIFEAMKKSSPKKGPRKIQPKLFHTAFEDKHDPLFKIIEPSIKITKSKKIKKKYISGWTATDFIKHLNQNLSLFGMALEMSNITTKKAGIRDAEWMNRLYDKLVKKLQYEMSNYVLKEYIEWWCGSFARLKTDQHICISYISSDEYIDKFVEFKQHKPTTKPLEEVMPSDNNTPPMEVYKKFGLNRLLIEKGIVESHKVMAEIGQTAIFSQISTALNSFSKSMFDRVMQVTMSNRYSMRDVVDFVSIARRSIQFHGLNKKYGKVDYKEFFKV
jgi:hypothetical protein